MSAVKKRELHRPELYLAVICAIMFGFILFYNSAPEKSFSPEAVQTFEIPLDAENIQVFDESKNPIEYKITETPENKLIIASSASKLSVNYDSKSASADSLKIKSSEIIQEDSLPLLLQESQLKIKKSVLESVPSSITSVWNASFGVPTGDTAYGITTDANNNIYIAGSTSFAGSSNLGLIVKYDSDGNYIWNRTIYSGHTSYAVMLWAVATDSSNNVYATGSFSSSSVTSRPFVIKYDSDGNYQWNVTYDNPAPGAVGLSIDLDSDNNIYVVSYFLNSGTYDILFYKLNSAGSLVWYKTIGGTGWDYARAVTVDNSNYVYIGGFTTSFGTQKDLWVLKYNSAGTQIWNKTLATTYGGSANGITSDSFNNIYVTGYANFTGNSFDAWTIKLDSSGNHIWNTSSAGTGTDQGRSIAVDSLSEVYIAGTTDSFGAGDSDFWIIKYNSTGQHLWNKTEGTSGREYGYGIAIDTKGSIYMTGTNDSQITGSSDILTLKYTSLPAFEILSLNNSISLTSDILFNVTAQDAVLSNATLYTDISGTWAANDTHIITGSENSTSWIINPSDYWPENTFKDTSYRWNVYVCDAESNCLFANNNETFGSWDLGAYAGAKRNSSSISLGGDDEQELPNNKENDGFVNMNNNVLLYHLNNESIYGENANIVYDFSGNGHNATPVATAQPYLSGHLNSAYDFDGDSDYINAGEGNNAYETPSWTWILWINRDTVDSTYRGLIKKSTASQGTRHHLHLYSSFRIHYGLGASSWNADNAAFTVGKWTQLAWTYNTTHTQIYQDGVLLDTQSYGTGTPSSTTDLTIGAAPGEDYFDGKIDEVAIFNTSLTSNEILEIYNRQKGNYASKASYTSRIFSAFTETAWKNISWDPKYQYGKEIDDGIFDTTGLVGYWKLNNNPLDSSGNGNDGVVSGDGVLNTTGKFNGAYSFAGSADYVTIADDPLLDLTGDMAVSAWIYLNAVSDDPIIIRNLNGWGLYMDSANSQKVGFGKPGADQVLSVQTLSPNRWYHLVAVHTSDTTTNEIFINGVLDNSGNGANFNDLNSETRIGTYVHTGGYDFNGLIDEIAVFNKTLSPSEIQELYLRGVARLNLSARSCNDAICSGETYGANCANASYCDLSPLPNNQYFQYKVNFETTDTNYTPELSANSVIIGYEEYVPPPYVTLIEPTNNSIVLNENNLFRFNATSAGLKNATLYSDMSGAWSVDDTLLIIGTDNSSNWTINPSSLWPSNTIIDSSYSWNVNVCDILGNCNWSTNNLTFSGWDLGNYYNVSANFSAGYMSLSANSSGHYENASGEYVSRIFDAGASVSWQNLTWDQRLGYGEELPDNQQTANSINMTGNVILFHLNNNSLDSSGKNNHGAITGGIYNITGLFNGAYNYSTTGNIDVGDYIDATQYYTLATWIRIYNIGLGYYVGHHYALLDFDSANTDTYRIYTPALGWTDTGVSTIFDQWHHIAWVFNGTNWNFYLNGNKVWNSGTSTISITEGFRIGQNGLGNADFIGSVDEFAIWNRSLSEQEVKNLYRVGMTSMSVGARSCNDVACSGETYDASCSEHSYCNLSSLSDNRYFQYKVLFKSGDVGFTPEFSTNSVTINYIGALGSCTPGQKESCTSNPSCLDNGIRTCNNEGEWGVCLCLPIYEEYKSSASTTNFSLVDDLLNVSSAILAKDYSRIQWASPIRAEGQNFDANIELGTGFVSVNASGLNETLNSSAEVQLYVNGCSSYTAYYSPAYYESLADIKLNGQPCNETSTPSCTSISCNGNTLTFDVEHFDSYGGEGNPPAGVPEFSVMTLLVALITVISGFFFIRKN